MTPRRNHQERVRVRFLLAQLVLDLTVARGQAVATREICSCFVAKYGPTHSLGRALRMLERDGELRSAPGRAGAALFWHVSHPVPVVQTDPAVNIASIVHQEVASGTPPIATSEVTARLHTTGITITGSAVWRLLKKLARRASRRPDGSADPLAIRWHSTMKYEGRTVHFWAPPEIEVVLPPGAVPVKPEADTAVLHLISEGRRRAGRPLSARELRWALTGMLPDTTPQVATTGHPRGSFGDLSVSRLVAALELLRRKRTRLDTRGADCLSTGEANQHPRVGVLTTFATCVGGAEPRYALGPISWEERCQCRVEDALRLYAPAEELAGLLRLERFAASDVAGGVKTFARMARVRRAVSSRVLHACLTDEDGTVTCIKALASRVRKTEELLMGWLCASNYSRPAVKRQLALHRARLLDLSAFESIVSAPHANIHSDECCCVGSVQLVGDAATVTMQEAAWWVNEAAKSLGLAETRTDGYSHYTLVRKSRRLPGARSSVDDATKAGSRSEVVLDRVDLIREVLLTCPQLGRAHALVTAADGLLGKVVRDRGLLERQLKVLPARDAVARHALVVGLGLLGITPKLDAAFVDRSDPSDAAAVALGIVLARAGEDGPVHAALRQLDRAAVGAAQRVTENARRRAEAGRWLTVAE